MNRWNIPDWLEREVTDRDTNCVYCGIEFFSSAPDSRKFKPTWEHIINDSCIINRENIARCCMSCNASKGAKSHRDWLNSSYCKQRKITKDTVATVVKMALIEYQ
jgi:5-methylcytosine-specific restriction endonuclease McrA